MNGVEKILDILGLKRSGVVEGEVWSDNELQTASLLVREMAASHTKRYTEVTVPLEKSNRINAGDPVVMWFWGLKSSFPKDEKNGDF